MFTPFFRTWSCSTNVFERESAEIENEQRGSNRKNARSGYVFVYFVAGVYIAFGCWRAKPLSTKTLKNSSATRDHASKLAGCCDVVDRATALFW